MKGKKYILQKIINFDNRINSILPLNDGRLALCKNDNLTIYDIKNNKEVLIMNRIQISYLYQFKDNKLYYYAFFGFTPKFNLIELTDNNKYIDRTDQLPKNIKAILIKEYCNKVMFSLLKEPSIDAYTKIQGKYQLIWRFKTQYSNFITLKSGLMALSTKYVLRIYNIYTLKPNKNSFTNYKGIKTITFFSNNFLLMASKDQLAIFDYKNNKIVQSISTGYNIFKIIVNKFKVLIAETNEKGDKSRFTTYKIDIKNNFNIKKLLVNDNPHKTEAWNVFNMVQCNDGTIITHRDLCIKVWK